MHSKWLQGLIYVWNISHSIPNVRQSATSNLAVLTCKKNKTFPENMLKSKRIEAILREVFAHLISALCTHSCYWWYLPRCSVQLYPTCTSHTCEQHKNLWMFYLILCVVQILTHLSSSETWWKRHFSSLRRQRVLKGMSYV